jgi:hypothetical protein
MRSSDGSRRGIVSTQSARGGFRMESECVPALTMPFLQSEYAVMRCWHCSGSSCGERIHSAGVLPDLITLRRFSATRHDTGATRRGAQLCERMPSEEGRGRGYSKTENGCLGRGAGAGSIAKTERAPV